jgi:hypothetical protein
VGGFRYLIKTHYCSEIFVYEKISKIPGIPSIGDSFAAGSFT